MRLYEFEAKILMEKNKIPVPQGILIKTPEEARKAAEDLGKVALKAQALVGGRAKAGLDPRGASGVCHCRCVRSYSRQVWRPGRAIRPPGGRARGGKPVAASCGPWTGRRAGWRLLR